MASVSVQTGIRIQSEKAHRQKHLKKHEENIFMQI